MSRLITTHVHVPVVLWYHVNIVKHDAVVCVQLHRFLESGIHDHGFVELTIVKLQELSKHAYHMIGITFALLHAMAQRLLSLFA